MIFKILFCILVVIWTLITGLIIFVFIRHRRTLMKTLNMLQMTKNSFSNNTQQFDQLKRSLEEFNKISQRLKK